MDNKYVYTKKRSQFGKQCFFEDVGPIVEENIFPNPSLNKSYIKQRIINHETQETVQYALHKIQTKYAKVKNSGIRHFEGSWPKEINPLDEEAVRRFRQRFMKSDSWITSMNSLMETMEHYILQNNTVDIYDNYFDDMIPTKLTISPEMRIISTYSDQELNVRPVNHLCWSMDRPQFAVAYCFKDRIQLPTNLSPNAYIWNIERPNKPSVILKSASASMAIEFNQRDPSLLISGLMSGQVCSWDTRTGDSPVQISVPLNSHRNPVSQAYWINSKTNTEFFSSSNSGTIKWWDIRKLRKPTEVLVMDLQNPERQSINESIPITVLQYESTMGSKFLVGLENGIIVNVNRKAISNSEKLHTRYHCHFGPVLSIDRNPTILKNFLTTGNNHAKVWTEETREHCLIKTTRKLGLLTGTCWSRSRLSLFFTINTEGTLDAYDLFQGIRTPTYRIQICKKSLTTIKPHNDGNILGIGSVNGNVYFVLCGGLFTTTFPHDKSFFLSYLDRCSLYEKTVEARKKETTLLITHVPPQHSKSKYRSRPRGSKEMPRRSRVRRHHGPPFADDEEIIEAEKQYFLKLEAEKEAFESEDSKEIERIYAYLRTEQIEREKKIIKIEEEYEEEEIEKKKAERPIALTLKTPRKTSIVSTSLEKIGGKFDEEIDESEELIKRKDRRRRALSEIPLKICSMDICEPKICCADVVKAEKERKIREKEKELIRKELTPFTKESLFKRKMSLTEQQYWQEKISELSKGVVERTPLQKRRILLGIDAPPDVLTKDVKDAKKYLEEWRDNLSVTRSPFYRSRRTSREELCNRLKRQLDDSRLERDKVQKAKGGTYTLIPTENYEEFQV
uniref:Dynein intermediate chain 3, ciliary n=1 Tax=Vespula pensylvanica TaxID=30213 RepID=A0A834P006_VESPE|nr:hypothetical protein H0235_009824 [Vespula pensylvanica]